MLHVGGAGGELVPESGRYRFVPLVYVCDGGAKWASFL